MQVGFFFWPYNLDLCEKLAERADRYGYAMIGIADTPGNAMDPWVSAALVARASQRTRVGICVTNLLTRHPAVSAAAIASLDHVSNGRAVLGIGAGHSGTKNVGLPKSRAKDLAEGVTFIKTLLTGAPATLGAASAHLPWIKRAPPVFLAASHPKPLQAAGQTADGVFANYGLAADNIHDSQAQIFAGAKDAGRAPEEIEIWQIGALDCNEDRDAARAKVGAMLAFLAGYVIGDKHLETRGVPEPLREPLLELRRRYSTRWAPAHRTGSGRRAHHPTTWRIVRRRDHRLFDHEGVRRVGKTSPSAPWPVRSTGRWRGQGDHRRVGGVRLVGLGFRRAGDDLAADAAEPGSSMVTRPSSTSSFTLRDTGSSPSSRAVAQRADGGATGDGHDRLPAVGARS